MKEWLLCMVRLGLESRGLPRKENIQQARCCALSMTIALVGQVRERRGEVSASMVRHRVSRDCKSRKGRGLQGSLATVTQDEGTGDERQG